MLTKLPRFLVPLESWALGSTGQVLPRRAGRGPALGSKVAVESRPTRHGVERGLGVAVSHLGTAVTTERLPGGGTPGSCPRDSRPSPNPYSTEVGWGALGLEWGE